ncbi:hypothetical protein OTU49_002328, partial [Cherax quadricarinatus]
MVEEARATMYKKPLDLFKNKELVTICAPMVRYSKLAFRSLVRKYGCDLCFTPMILSECFVQSVKARHSDFTTSKEDRPLVVQFAASKGEDWAEATRLIAPHTVDFARQMEAAGASFITVHGRTQEQRGDPVCLEAIADIKSALQIPVIANGDIRSMDDAHQIQKITGVNGVMAARGMLENPAMYAGYKTTPLECVKDWVNIALSTGTHFTCFHHHLIYMMEKSLTRAERRYFNVLGSTSGVLTYLTEKYMV